MKPGLLRDRNVALFVGVSLVSGFAGTAMSLVARVWVMTLTGSASLAGLAGLCVYLPTLLGPAFGTVVDRFRRRPLLVWTNVAMACLLLVLLAVRSAGQVWLIYLVMVGYGVAYVLVDAGEAALLPAALPGEALGRVNGVRMSAQEGTKLIAPLAGAGVFAWAGGPTVATLTAVLLLAAAGLYRLVRAPEAHLAPGPAPSGRRIRDGVRFLRSHPGASAVVGTASVAMLMSGLGTAPVYSVVHDGLHKPAAFLGVLASVQGGGSIAGGLGAGRLLDRLGGRRFAATGALLQSIGILAQCTSRLPAAVAGSLIIGIGLPWTIVAAMTTIQRGTPSHLTGRVAATANTLIFGAPALSIPLGAAALVVVDYRVPLAVAALGSLLAGCRLLARRPAPDRVQSVAAAGENGP